MNSSMADELDLIAVGAGLAGLTAANRSLELGRGALVLERSTIPRHLCASRTNGGVFHVGFRSVTTDPDELVRVIDEATGNFVEPRSRGRSPTMPCEPSDGCKASAPIRPDGADRWLEGLHAGAARIS